jgi:hypothetical protein
MVEIASAWVVDYSGGPPATNWVVRISSAPTLPLRTGAPGSNGLQPKLPQDRLLNRQLQSNRMLKGRAARRGRAGNGQSICSGRSSGVVETSTTTTSSCATPATSNECQNCHYGKRQAHPCQCSWLWQKQDAAMSQSCSRSTAKAPHDQKQNQSGCDGHNPRDIRKAHSGRRQVGVYADRI